MKLLQSEVGSSRKVNEWGFGTEFRFIFVACVWGEEVEGSEERFVNRRMCMCQLLCVCVFVSFTCIDIHALYVSLCG